MKSVFDREVKIHLLNSYNIFTETIIIIPVVLNNFQKYKFQLFNFQTLVIAERNLNILILT